MEYTSYQLVSNNTASLNTASYLSRTEHTAFVKGFETDLWYGFSANDVVELGVWDRENNFLGWNVLNNSKSYNEITLGYVNTLNFPVTYSYSELSSDLILYKNSKILVSPPEELSSSMAISDGSYFLQYNYTRNMAGSLETPLIIKDISPSRREIKLIPLTVGNASYDAFCNKNVLLQDVSSLYIDSVKNCPYGQIYSEISSLYTSEINTIKSIFVLNTDGAMLNFLKNIYEDVIIYSTIPVATSFEPSVLSGSLIRIQGIKTYFINYVLQNVKSEVAFDTINQTFRAFTSSSIERKFSPIGKNPSSEYVKAKEFVYDFFTKYFYELISTNLENVYTEKYLSTLKNALNFGNNRLLPILTHANMDERVSPEDPLTLLVKLQSELPSDIAIQSSCWVSNISLTPYVLNAIIRNPNEKSLYKIGPPNFSAPIANVSLAHLNKSFSADDLENDDDVERELVVSKNLAELNVDYSNFENFVVFSLAELRLKIFKNKIINISLFDDAISTLNNNNTSFLAVSGSIYPFYTQELSSSNASINDIVDSFDGYESYLYRSGNYEYSNGNFVSSSYVTDMDSEASSYDKNNLDNLVNNCPAHILVDSENDDYIVFISMIGHFFDDIYLYISNVPSQKTVGHGATEEFTRRIVDYMLETFGWNVEDSLEQSSLINNYLNSNQISGLDTMSAEDRLKEIRNRILINLPRIYKTKGTEESVRAILSCYGIPSSLLSCREFGGVNYTDDSASYTTYERAYMYQWDTSSKYDHFRTDIPSNCKTFLYKFCMNDSTPYAYNSEQIMLGLVAANATSSTDAGSGDWAVGFIRQRGENLGKLFFRIGYDSDVRFKIYSPTFPMFDGSIYSVMLRRNANADGFDYSADTNVVPTNFDLYVQKNESGIKVLNLTSSGISYDNTTNQRFASGSRLMFGGWFADRNGQGFNGAMDKLQVWYDPVPNNNFNDYTNNINGYSFSGSRAAHESLVFRMHTDYPFDMRQIAPGQSISPSLVGLTGSYQEWVGTWRNANPFYASGSLIKQTAYLAPSIAANSDMMANKGAWSGSQKLAYSSGSCNYVSQSTYPWQFKVIEYPSTWGISKYGPNKFHNEKIKKSDQIVSTRFDDKSRSTYFDGSDVAGDSNQIGFFADPQDFHNKDIVRHFGNFDFMDSIGSPTNQFSSSYQSLNILRNRYATSLNAYSGSRTLFNEIITLHKLYFNRSIFDAIKNVVPARSNVLLGVVIEPSILERPKYQSKTVFGESNTGSVFYADVTAAHYSKDPNTKLLRITESLLYADFGMDTGSMTNFDATTLPDNLTLDIGLKYINLPTRIYPINYLPGGTYISDTMDNYQLGHFAGGVSIEPDFIIPSPDEPTSDPVADFVGDVLSGTAPLTVNFTNLSINASAYLWDFGDGSTSTDENPTHVYSLPGYYTVSLVANNFVTTNTKLRENYIHVTLVSLPCSNPIVYTGGPAFPFEQVIYLGTPTGNVTLTYDAFNIPDKFIVIYNGVEVINTGYHGAKSYQTELNKALIGRGLPEETIISGGHGTKTFVKTSDYPYATVKVYAPLTHTGWNFTLGCPN